ncbi:hypothetical protein DPMN_068997 [Dreissena polymorpha]|uniref:Uncharacterized protein n=1 Tax=Dreissena polymorpha TaxID=45954 RepID=A0A9D4BUL3_DREPO|nr:hypothetical protein DPMN_068997 [Dreissena polymorpha]
MDNAPTPCGHVFQQTRNIFELIQDIIISNVLSKFHDDWTIHVTVRVYKKPYKEECPASAGHVFQPTGTIFKHVQDIIETNLLKKIHDDRTLNMASRVNHDQPPGGHVFNQPETSTGAIFKLVQDIIDKNLLTRFHDDRSINVASRVFTISVKSNVFTYKKIQS